MKRTLHLLIAFICTTSLFAQENYSNGYIITNSNDTIYGKIDLRTPAINQQKCYFATSTHQKSEYNPGEIKSYREIKSGKYYISKEVSLQNLSQVQFVEYLVQGGLNLFYFEDNRQGYFLFEEEGKEPLYITQTPAIEEDYKIKVDNKYRGILNYHFQNSSQSLIKTISNSKFNQKSMIAIAKQYNDENCLNPGQESCIIFENKTPDDFGVKLKISAYTGIQHAIFEGDYYKGKSTFPLIGGQVSLSNPRWSKYFSAILDLSLSKIDDESPYLELEGQGSQNKIKYDMINLSAKLGIRYTYSKHKLRPFVEGGFAFDYLLKNKNYQLYDKEYMLIYNTWNFRIGGYAGLGLEYNIAKEQFIFVKFNFDAYTKSPNTLTKGDDRLKLWQIKVGYTF